MASLKNGVLIKLIEDMKSDDVVSDEDPPKPVVLQIRSIIPVLEEGDLWPNRGFFLKVSDSTHALYVSLSEEQNEMILGNKLKLGQFIHVQKLKKSHPVPLLKGVTPIPGPHRCEGNPVDINSPADLGKVLESSSAADSVVEKGVILEKKIPFSRKGSRPGRSLSASKARPGEIKTDKCVFTSDHDSKKTGCGEIIGGVWPRSMPSSVDNDSDVDSVSSSKLMSRRRSWQESEILGVKEIFDSSVVKQEIKLPPKSRSANVSPIRSVRYDSSDDNSSSVSRRKRVGSPQRLIKSGDKSQGPVPKTSNVQIANTLCGLVYERKGAESGILWNSIPSNLVKLGKEVIRQRDNALLAAAEALQEACASERVLNSLSTLSRLPLAEGDDLQPYVDKCFDLQDDLARSKLITQSLASISPVCTPESEPSTNSIKETLNTALERKKNAMTWIKSAVALDLSSNPTVDPTNIVKEKKTSSKRGDKPKNTCIVKKSRSNTDFNNQADWTRGSTLSSAAKLATSMQDECRKMFLSHVEKYLDEVDRKSLSMDNEGEVAGMMYKVKMVSDRLSLVSNSNLEDRSEAEAHERVRNKIYGILLRHVERTAMAFERVKGPI
ncbi:hypothetical protein CASFOL_035989 [Castilleja foliolosa]|uniref:Uncharacterized protein n=1 Tax=Castilleja foliolosa TaxID=1961234 RepID=A0ABD3BWM8_9LAMI